MSNGDIVGRVAENVATWYLLDSGELVSFHTLFTNADRKDSRTIYAAVEDYPGAVANKLGLKYHFMRNATQNEIDEAIKDRKLEVKEVIAV